MIDEDIAEYVLDAALSKESLLLAEVRVERIDTSNATVKAGEVSSVMSNKDAGMYVRVVLPTGIGFASSNRISKPEGIELARRALKIAKNPGRKTLVVLSKEATVKTSWEVKQKKPLADVSIEDRVEFLRSLDKAVVKTKEKVEGRFYDITDRVFTSYFANSEGSRIGSVLPRVTVNAYVLVSHKGETEQSMREWAGTGGWERVDEWALPEKMDAEVRMLRKMIEKGKKVKPGKYDLVCGGEVSGIAAHESCGHPMEADRILGREMSQAGKSFVSPDMIGQKIGSVYATVIDDPTLPGSYGYYAYDHEGVRARPRYLYKEGVINEFLHNRETAGRLGVRSNGSSRSETYIREPIVRMGNTYVAPGDFEEDEMFGSIKDGVLMKSFTEWNIDDKRFNQKYVSREAYFIKDGELAGPARGCALEITTPGFWGAIDAASKRVEQHAGECGKGDPIQSAPCYMGGSMIRLRGVTLK
jgi:TldD protein